MLQFKTINMSLLIDLNNACIVVLASETPARATYPKSMKSCFFQSMRHSYDYLSWTTEYHDYSSEGNPDL